MASTSFPPQLQSKPQIDTVEEFRRTHRIARVELFNAAAKYGAIANLRGQKDHAKYVAAQDELEEAARQFSYREQLLGMALREQSTNGRRDELTSTRGAS